MSDSEVMNPDVWHLISSTLPRVTDEMKRQRAKWDEQNHPDGTGPHVLPLNDGPTYGLTYSELRGLTYSELAVLFRDRCNANTPDSDNWAHIFLEEAFEAMAENDEKLEVELIQVIAVCASWLAARERRRRREPSAPQES